MVRDDFAIFILSHGRPDMVKTVKTLKLCGYTGKYYIILDNEDPTEDRYKELFGEDKVIIFDKKAAGKKFDIYDNFEGRNVVVFARNMCFDIARSLGLKFFAEFDDDYLEFRYRIPDGKSLRAVWIEDFDEVCEAMIDFVDSTGVRVAAFAQNGEMGGGINGSVWRGQVLRKAMNTFFFKVGTPEEDMCFPGRINEDTNAYTILGHRGEVFIQTPMINMNQLETQYAKGGLTDAYLEYGTYVKSFYSVLACPSCVKISTLGNNFARVHHKVLWENCAPKIISDRFKN